MSTTEPKRSSQQIVDDLRGLVSDLEVEKGQAQADVDAAQERMKEIDGRLSQVQKAMALLEGKETVKRRGRPRGTGTKPRGKTPAS